MYTRYIALLVLLTLTLVGCASPQAVDQDKAPVSNSQQTLPTPVPDSPIQADNTEIASVPSADSALRSLTEKAKNDLVSQFGVQRDQIKILGARTVTWPDASLGCPQQDMAYAEVLTPGYWILLEADSNQYPYHTDQANQLVLCLDDLSPRADMTPLPMIPVKPDDIKDGEPWVPVN
jgi:hypothetical protein